MFKLLLGQSVTAANRLRRQNNLIVLNFGRVRWGRNLLEKYMVTYRSDTRLYQNSSISMVIHTIGFVNTFLVLPIFFPKALPVFRKAPVTALCW